MSGNQQHPSPTNATYVEPSAEKILESGTKIGNLFQHNMSQQTVLHRLAEHT